MKYICTLLDYIFENYINIHKLLAGPYLSANFIGCGLRARTKNTFVEIK